MGIFKSTKIITFHVYNMIVMISFKGSMPRDSGVFVVGVLLDRRKSCVCHVFDLVLALLENNCKILDSPQIEALQYSNHDFRNTILHWTVKHLDAQSQSDIPKIA